MQGSVYSYRLKSGAKRWGYVYDLPATGTAARRVQQRKQGFSTERAAARALREQLAQLDAGIVVERSSMTLAQYLLEEWLPTKQPTTQAGAGRRSRGRLGIATWQQYHDYIRAYIAPHLGAVKLQDLSPAMVERAYTELELRGGKRQQGLSPATLANAHGILHKAMADAVRWSKVPRNVMDLVDAPRADKPDTAVWDIAQLRAFLRYVEDDPYYALWLLYATTGLRRGEALGLRWPDLNLDLELAHVRQTLGSLHGNPVWKPRPKSEASARSLALDPMTVAALRAYRAQQNQWRLSAGPEWDAAPVDHLGVAKTDTVFTWEDGRLINPERISKWFEELRRTAGLPKIRLHDVRHSYATAALRQATGWHEVKTLSRRLGHASVGMTLDTYSHALPADDRAQANTLAALLLNES